MSTKEIKQNTNNVWRGTKRLFNTVQDLLTGLSAIAVMSMAGAYANQHRTDRPLFSVMVLAVAVMGIVAAKALGSYLNKLGKEMEQ